ncbi:signal peptide peptidase SppA [Pannonibacter indicus]|uniref:Signal peptide peptidase SppA, 36K type n=1 Tax=Pannonibacter indicus TaxID=466044 RepID=A0A0K6I0J2_9HYPH|nr:signal peptide peptidase SppA [Pannonibacter indicus]CUA96679.1 signal peptide peptidase SppA, 36K type [Pannonibacter indicus]
MSLDAEAITDRRRLRRKLVFWRVAAFLILAVGLISGLIALGGGFNAERSKPHIARIPIEGVIMEDRDQLKLIREIGENERVAGVIISINSPGGSTTGGEALYQALHELSKKKPAVAEIRTVGASAGYMVALASDHIVARHNSITGSIGVLFQFGNAEKLLDMVGVKMDAVKSAPMKAEPDFYSDPSPETRDMLALLVGDSYDWFVKLVAERRKLSPEEARAVADGSIVTGFRAQERKLVDAIGGEDAAIAWLEKEKGVAKDLPVVTWKVPDERSRLPFAARMSQGIGEGAAKALIEGVSEAKGLISPSLTLDGLVSVWHAPGGVPGGQEQGSGE